MRANCETKKEKQSQIFAAFTLFSRARARCSSALRVPTAAAFAFARFRSLDEIFRRKSKNFIAELSRVYEQAADTVVKRKLEQCARMSTKYFMRAAGRAAGRRVSTTESARIEKNFSIVHKSACHQKKYRLQI